MFGNTNLINMNDEEKLLEVPLDEDENIGDQPSKRVKRKKSKEERLADRKVIFWTLLAVVGMTIFFWTWPRIKGYKFGWPEYVGGKPKVELPKPEWKNYVEYKL